MSSQPLKHPATGASLYEADFFRWSQEQGRALRERRVNSVDWENVAEEIESSGRSDRYEIESRMEVLLARLLKLRQQPERRSNSWRATIEVQRMRTARRVAESPSLKHYPAEVLEASYRLARPVAADQMDRAFEDLPDRCPFSVANALDQDFWPE